MRPQRVAFFGSEAKHEIFREAVAVALDLLVQAFYRHAVKLRQIAVEDDFLLAEHKNARFYGDDQGRLGIVHVRILSGSARFGVAICDLIRDTEGHRRKSLKRRGRGEEPRRAQRKAFTAKIAKKGRKGRSEKAFHRPSASLRAGSGREERPQRSQKKATRIAKNGDDGREALEIGKRFGLVNFPTTRSARSVSSRPGFGARRRPLSPTTRR